MRPIGTADLFFRAADVPLVSGNALRILSDAGENYPAWMNAIARASAFVHLEMYIVHNDRIGRRFRDLMMTATYVESLRAAARHGVDVRILVPGNSDVQWVANMSRTLYRRLLEGQMRVFEWNGPMLHAKSAVVDGRWTRIGSTNLNISSWIRNWELDVVIDNTSVAERMEAISL